MKIPYNSPLNIRLFLSLFLAFGILSGQAEQNLTSLARADEAQSTDVIDAWTMKDLLGRGIHLDNVTANNGSATKLIYDPGYLDTLKAAGFQSVRYFFGAKTDPAQQKARIDDALDRGLPVVICMWGDQGWMKNPEKGIGEFVEAWKTYAEYYKAYDPEDLVFELLNEPSGLNPAVPEGLSDVKAIEYINAVIPAIRAISPDRILGVSSPGLNNTDKLVQYVTPEYLTYTLADGTGFIDDDKLIGIVHMYEPYNISHWTEKLYPAPHDTWKGIVEKELLRPKTWSEKYGKPIAVTEWGAWAPPLHTGDDYYTYLKFIADKCSEFNFSQMVYCLGFNNQWHFNMFNTESGWNQRALDALTGVTAPAAPPLSQLINSEFASLTENWKAEGTATISSEADARMSGSRALKVVAKESNLAEVYQETDLWPTTIEALKPRPNRNLISIRKGKRYEIKFLAKALSETGSIKVRFTDFTGSSGVFFTSAAKTIDAEKQEYTIEYTHTGSDVDGVRLSFLFGQQNQTVLLDRLSLIGYSDVER